MKYRRIFGTLALAVILSLLLIGLPATAVLAQEITLVDPDEGGIGDTVYVEGEDFSVPNDYVLLFFSKYAVSIGEESPVSGGIDSDLYEYLGSADTDSSGDFEFYFEVPDELTAGVDSDEYVESGRYYIVVTEFGDIQRDYYAFDVIAGDITITPRRGPVDTEVQIDGTGFYDNEDITIEYDGHSVDISGDEDTDSHGEFTSYILIPESIAGDHTITVTGEDSDYETEADFEVESEITLDPESGAPGSEVTVTGTGFGDREYITIYFDGDEVDIESGDEDTSSDGSFESTFLVPAGTASGDYDVEVEDDDGNSDKAEFTTSLTFTINPTNGNVGTPITASGLGFAASTTINVAYYDSAGTTALIQVSTTSLTDGTFTATLNAPASLHGNHNIKASDNTTSLTKVFTMESAAPPVPQPMLPEQGTELQDSTFEWGSVVDDSSPVTYDLQVATDENFIEGSILVDRPGLTTLTYTLPDAEKLEPTEEDAPYYWRVRATDAASNVSAWSPVVAFQVGSTFNFSLPWWALLAICAGGFIPLGIFIGRRTAYSYY